MIDANLIKSRMCFYWGHPVFERLESKIDMLVAESQLSSVTPENLVTRAFNDGRLGLADAVSYYACVSEQQPILFARAMASDLNHFRALIEMRFLAVAASFDIHNITYQAVLAVASDHVFKEPLSLSASGESVGVAASFDIHNITYQAERIHREQSSHTH